MVKKTKKLTLSEKIKQLAEIPFSIKWVSISLFLFTMGWGLGADTFFSIYVKSIIGSGLNLTLIWTLLPIIKLLTVIPIGILNDKGMSKYLLLYGKIWYAISGAFYFWAGFEQSAFFLICAVILNGIGSSTMYTTYRTLYWKKTQTNNRSKILGVYFSSINMAYVIGALISAFLVKYLDLPYMYLFVVIFAILSILQDSKIQDFVRRKFSKTWWKYLKKQNTDLPFEYEIDEEYQNMENILRKKNMLLLYFREIFSLSPWKKMFEAMKSYDGNMYVALSSQALVNFMNYVGFLFIPLVAMQNNLSLSEIAILFAVMRLPYLVNILIGNIWDKYSKKILITILVLFSAGLFFWLGSTSSFMAIVVASFGLSLAIAMLQPITSALILGYAKPKDKGLIAGMQEFSSKIGEIIGSLGIGLLTALVGMNVAFQFLWCALAVLGGYLLLKKLFQSKEKKAEDHQWKDIEVPIFAPQIIKE